MLIRYKHATLHGSKEITHKKTLQAWHSNRRFQTSKL